MTNLEQTVEKSFFGQVKDNLSRIKHSVAGKIAVYSLAGFLSAGLGSGCATAFAYKVPSNTPYLGVNYKMITPELAKKEKLPFEEGALIYGDLGVLPHSPADKAGLQAGDIIIKLDDEKITQDNNLVKAIQKYNVGDALTIKILRNGEGMEGRTILEMRQYQEEIEFCKKHSEIPPHYVKGLGDQIRDFGYRVFDFTTFRNCIFSLIKEVDIIPVIGEGKAKDMGYLTIRWPGNPAQVANEANEVIVGGRDGAEYGHTHPIFSKFYYFVPDDEASLNSVKDCTKFAQVEHKTTVGTGGGHISPYYKYSGQDIQTQVFEQTFANKSIDEEQFKVCLGTIKGSSWVFSADIHAGYCEMDMRIAERSGFDLSKFKLLHSFNVDW